MVGADHKGKEWGGARPFVAPKGEADMVKAVAEALDRERKHREALLVRVATLENEKAALEARVERLEKSVLDRHAK